MRRFVPLVVFLVLAGLITHGHNAASGDPVHYLIVAHSVAFDRDLAVEKDYDNPHSLISIPPHERHALAGRDGVLRPVHDVGWPVVSAPLVALAYVIADWSQALPESLRNRARLNRFIAFRQVVSLMMIGFTIWAAMLFMAASRNLGADHSSAAWWALAWVLSPPMLTHGYVYFTEVPTAILAMLCWMRRDSLAGPRWRSAGLLLGSLIGLLVLIHARNIGLALALGAIAVWRVRHELGRATTLAAGIVLMAALKLLQNQLFWGTWITNPHEQPGAWPGLVPLLNEAALRAGGLLFDGRHGLLLSAPLYLLVAAGFVSLWRRSRQTALELVAVVCMYLVFILLSVTNIHGWRGGWSPAARFLVPIAPFLAMPIVTLGWRHGRALITGILGAQVLVTAYLWSHPMLSWSEGSGPSPWLERLAGGRIAGAVPSWDQFDATTATAALVVIAVIGATTFVMTRRRPGLKPRQSRWP